MAADYPTRWIHLDAAAKALGVKPRMAHIYARRDRWRQTTDHAGRTVYALTDIRTTIRRRKGTS